MASAELFNLSQPNQKQFSDNNTMELSMAELTMFEGLAAAAVSTTSSAAETIGSASLNEGEGAEVKPVEADEAAAAAAASDDMNGTDHSAAETETVLTAVEAEAAEPAAEAAAAAPSADDEVALATGMSFGAYDEAIASLSSSSSNSSSSSSNSSGSSTSTSSSSNSSSSSGNGSDIVDELTAIEPAFASYLTAPIGGICINGSDASIDINATTVSAAALQSDESGLDTMMLLEASSGAKDDGSESLASLLMLEHQQQQLQHEQQLSMLSAHRAQQHQLLSEDVSGSSSRSGSIGLGSSLASANSGMAGTSGNGGGGCIGGDLMDGALEDGGSLGGEAEEQECKICKSGLEQPRVLSCLHVVCEGCLETLALDEAGDVRNCIVACPVCKQTTAIDSRGPAGLHLDYTITNTVDLNTVEPHALVCTSCTSTEQAMSRCNDCANFLCASCDKAHKYMRCFENHTVVLLAELRASAERTVIHKPLFCRQHAHELLKYYCFSCQQVACTDCLVAVHKGAEHRYDVLGEAEPHVRADLERLVRDARAQIDGCDARAARLSNSLQELQQQHDGARERCVQTYERCAAVLERCRDAALGDLERLHSERELQIMDAMHGVEQTVGRIETTCRFTRRVLTEGNGAELMSLQPLISRQVQQVMVGSPQVEEGVELRFEGKWERFEQLAQDAFGRCRTVRAVDVEAAAEKMEATEAVGAESALIAGLEMATAPAVSPPATLAELMLLSAASSNGGGMHGGGMGVIGSGAERGGSHPASSPISMQSSFESDLLGNGFMMSNGNGGLGNGMSPDVLQQHQHQQHQQQQQQQQHQHQQHQHQHQHMQQMHQNHQHLSNMDLLKREQPQHQQQLACNPLMSSVSSVAAHSPLGNGPSLASVLGNGGVGVGNGLNNGINSAGLSVGLNGLGNNGGGVGPITPSAPVTLNNMAGLSSIAEYNLHRLANLVESNGGVSVDHHHQQQQQQQQLQQQQQHQQLHHHMQQQQQHNNHHNLVDDNTVATLVGNGGNGLANGNGVGSGTAFTLSDLINGDQRAFHALAKLNMNGAVGGALLNRGPSPSSLGGGGGGVNVLADNNGSSLLSDFIGMPGNTSPIGTIGSSIGDDMNNGGGGGIGGGGGSGGGGINSSSNSALTSAMNLAGRTKATPMQIRCKFGSLGASKAQFNSPHGFCLGVDEEIIVADTNNHRIQVFEKVGTFKFQFGVPGKEEGQLWYPRKVAVMRTSGKFVVCDRGNERSRMQIFTKNGHFIKKIAIRYIDIVAGLAVTNQGHIVAVDSVSPTVFIIAEDGNLVHWFDCSDYMREPSDIAISGSDFYVCDFKGHNVAVFNENGTFLHRIGDEKITCFPNGIDISDAGDILIGDSHGNRFHVACFSRDGVLQSEFECPYVKVSRCCGLKITSEGYVVTLAKNNHHVLVLNTLYIH